MVVIVRVGELVERLPLAQIELADEAGLREGVDDAVHGDLIGRPAQRLRDLPYALRRFRGFEVAEEREPVARDAEPGGADMFGEMIVLHTGDDSIHAKKLQVLDTDHGDAIVPLSQNSCDYTSITSHRMPKLLIAFASSSAVALGAFALQQQIAPETIPTRAPTATIPVAAPVAPALPSFLARAATEAAAILSPEAEGSDDVRAPQQQDVLPHADGLDVLTIAAPVQPAPTLAPAGAGGVPFTSFTLSAGQADVEIRSVTIERTGPGEDGIFEGVVVVDEDGEEVSDERRFDANHRIVFAMSLTIPAGESRTFTVLGSITDDAARFAGQSPVLAVTMIDASRPVRGELPVRGTAQTVNDTIVLGGATALLSPDDPNTDTRRFIGDTRVRFSAIRLTADSREDLELSGIAWRQDGTASAGDIENVVIVADGRTYATEADGRSYASSFSPAIRIPRGQSIDLAVLGDLTKSGAGRTVQFNIDSSDDISLVGLEYGFGVGVAPGGNTATEGHSVFITSDGTEDGDEGTPFFAGSVVTIQGGTEVYIGR